MQYFITFLEGILSFISPCTLPMLPVYISYFAGGAEKRRALPRALCFVAGFTLVFTLMGLFAGALGGLLIRYRRAVQIVCGVAVILFGISYLAPVSLPFLKGAGRARSVTGLLSAFVFGLVYSVSLTPCVGAFLGSALMLAGTAGTAAQGVALLALYSLGLGLPFLLSAVLIGELEGAFARIKRHYGFINKVCGGFLILVGALMALGWMNAMIMRWI